MAVRQGRRATTGFLRDFQEFALKGNIVELAIAVIIGAAFGKIVTSFVQDITMPIINPLVPQGDWRNLTVGPGIKLGSFIGTLIDFAIVTLVLFLTLRFLARLKRQETPPAPNEKECPHCLEKVPLAATRCRACTSDLL